MARTRTLTELLADVRKAADREGAATRFPDSEVTRYINQAIQEFNLELNVGDNWWNLSSSTGTTVADTDTSTLPSDAVQVYGVDINDGGFTYALTPYEFMERADDEHLFITGASNTGRPSQFRVDGSALYFLPTPGAAYSYTVWYLAAPTDLSTGADTFDGVAGWEEWITLRAAMKVLRKDNDQDHYSLLSSELAEQTEHIRFHAAMRNRTASARRVDTRGRRRRQKRHHYGPWSE